MNETPKTGTPGDTSLDRLLDQLTAPLPPAALIGRVLNLPGEERAKGRRDGVRLRLPKFILQPAALLAAGVAGFVIGTSLPEAKPPLAVFPAAQTSTEFDAGTDFSDETALIGLTWPEAEPPEDNSAIEDAGEEEFDSASLI